MWLQENNNNNKHYTTLKPINNKTKRLNLPQQLVKEIDRMHQIMLAKYKK